VLGYTYPLLNAFLTLLWFFLFFLWIFILITVIIDIFRSSDMGGWGKAGWFVFVIFLPLLGVLVYLIARGGSMHERAAKEAQAQDEAFRAYVKDAASSSGADELDKLAKLRDQGVISEAEFQQGKAKILG
jgi:hypothetical protein